MKILIITASFPPEPLVTSILSHDIAKKLAENNEVIVLCPKPTRPFGMDFGLISIHNDQSAYKRIQLFSYTSPQFSLFGRFRESYSIGKACQSFITKNHSNIDVLYVNTWPLFGQYFVVRTAKKFHLPVVIHIQDIYPESLLAKIPFFRNFFLKLLLPIDKYIQQNSLKVITISPSMKSLLVKTRELEEAKVEVVFNWQNEDHFIEFRKKKVIALSNSHFTFMYLGSLNMTAAVHILIIAFSKAGLANTRLVIAGNGPERSNLMALSKAYRNTNIEFWEAQKERVPEMQDQADVLLLNLSKGAAQFAMPSKLPAYLFSQKPIIASVDEDSDVARSIITANCGWVVPPENVEQLAKKMRKVTLIPSDQLKIYGENGFNFAMKDLSKKTNLQKVVSIIENSIRF
ncbi:MAG: glycosyltransferase family 4 protein [Flavobacterium sp.]|nr:glycosyltransferase family 4 protein [Flavobacterium sp.]